MDPITALVIGTLTKMASEDYRDIKRLILSSGYKYMSTNEKNKRLRRELAASIPIRVLMQGPFCVYPLIWQKMGTSDELREKIEDYFL